jgi:hypothetical protein
MTHDEAIEAAARLLARRNYPGATDADIDEMWEGFTEDARAVAPLLMEHGARLMQEAAYVAWKLDYSEAGQAILDLDPAAIVREEKP